MTTPLPGVGDMQQLGQETPGPGQRSAMAADFSDSPVEREKTRLGPMRDLLTRHGVVRRYGKWRCPAPDHPDEHPSASVYVAADGDERVHCHACGFDGDVIDVERALGG